ncbi:MAG: DUF4936 family protein [Sheuella sp.]|jgi:hypothetical protein|nr:DUF4936 family protein [Sheuella sp.]
MNLFVYYKLLESEHPNLRIKIQIMQSELKSIFPTLSYDLMKRPDIDDTGRETWMEIYSLQDIDINAFRNELDARVLTAELPVPRRNEIFIPV